MVNTDRIEGALRETGGKAERAVGDLVGDRKTQSEGVVDEVAGAAQNAYGQVKDALRSAALDAPEYVDRALDTSERYYRQGSRALGFDPVVALLLAGALGYAAAWLVHRSR